MTNHDPITEGDLVNVIQADPDQYRYIVEANPGVSLKSLRVNRIERRVAPWTDNNPYVEAVTRVHVIHCDGLVGGWYRHQFEKAS